MDLDQDRIETPSRPHAAKIACEERGRRKGQLEFVVGRPARTNRMKRVVFEAIIAFTASLVIVRVQNARSWW